jgi:hypothetical protein
VLCALMPTHQAFSALFSETSSQWFVIKTVKSLKREQRRVRGLCILAVGGSAEDIDVNSGNDSFEMEETCVAKFGYEELAFRFGWGTMPKAQRHYRRCARRPFMGR